jgi:hypothetical protein
MSASDAAALVAILQAGAGDAPSVATEDRTRDAAPGSASVEIKIGQDEQVLSTLDLPRAQRAPLALRGRDRTTVNRETQ